MLWDYMKREDPILNNYDLYQKKEEVKDGNKEPYSQSRSVFTTMTFTPDGSELLIGRSNGFIEVMDPITGKYIKLTMPLKITENKVSPITGLIVSRDG